MAVCLGTNREPVELVVLNGDVWVLPFDSTEDKDALLDDLFGDQVPLDLREVLESDLVAFKVGDQAHGARADVAGAVFWVLDRKFLPRQAFHIDHQKLIEAKAMLADAP